MEKKITVVIPTYNREETIISSLSSVLDQTYKKIEVIIVDDFSKDNTLEKLKTIEDSRVRIICHENNKGACVARNTGIKYSTGEYIAFHDSDDTWKKEKLEKQIDIMDKMGADIIACRMNEYVDGRVKRIIPKSCPNGFINNKEDIVGIGTQTLLGKASVFGELKFDEEMPRFQELELLMRAISKYHVFCMDEVLVDHYIMKDSISVNYERLYHACCLLKQKHPEIVYDYPGFTREIAWQLYKGSVHLPKNSKVHAGDMYDLAITLNKNKENLIRYVCGKLGILKTFEKILFPESK